MILRGILDDGLQLRFGCAILGAELPGGSTMNEQEIENDYFFAMIALRLEEEGWDEYENHTLN